MDVYKNSNGDYIYKHCQKSHLTMTLALDCAEAHKKTDQNLNGVMIRGLAADDVNAYKEDMEKGDLLAAAQRLCVSMIEDYHVSKESDLQSKEKVGAITMKLAENASNALNSLTKSIYGEKKTNMNVHVDGTKKQTALDALRDAIVGKQVDVTPEKEEKSDE